MTTTSLDPELVARVKSLTPQQKDELFDSIWEEGELFPERCDLWTDIQKRRDDLESGRVRGMTREESEAHIRDEIRKLGIEL